jgi:hypothetical protein
MRSQFAPIGMWLAAALALGACRSSDRQRVSEKSQESADKAEVLAREAEGRASEMREKAAEKTDRTIDEQGQAAAEARVQRDDFVARSNAKLQEMDTKIAELETAGRTRADKATRDALVALRQLRLDASHALENARGSSQTDWSRLSATFDVTVDKIGVALDDLYKKLNLVPAKSRPASKTSP